MARVGTLSSGGLYWITTEGMVMSCSRAIISTRESRPYLPSSKVLYMAVDANNWPSSYENPPKNSGSRVRLLSERIENSLVSIEQRV